MSHNVAAADEKTARANLKTFLETIPTLGSVFTRRRRINNRADFVAKFGYTSPDVPTQKIIRFAEIELIKCEDSDVEGFDDCPVLIATYGVHIFQEFFDGDDDANSNDQFIASFLTIRDKFLETREFAAGNFLAESEPVTLPEFVQFGNDTFTDAIGHFCDLNLKLNFYDG
jgi:hypothetical protein